MRDLHNNIYAQNALNIQTISTDTTTNGNIIDLQGFDSCEFIIQAGTYTDGDYTPLIHEGDASNLSDASAVADADLIGTGISSGQEAAAAFTTNTDDNKVTRIGYKGSKRYVRLSLVSTNTATNGATLGAIAVLGNPADAPTAANTAA